MKNYILGDYLRDACGSNAGFRLDHFLLNAGLGNRLVKGAVDVDVRSWPHSSDHAPVLDRTGRIAGRA